MIILNSVATTTNSITVKVSTKRNEGGKIEYYIKAEGEKDYKKIKEEKTKENADNLEYIYTGLEQNKKYSIKIVAVTKNKQKAETIKEDIQVGSVTSITEKDVTFTYSPSSWTNGSVKVTATLKDMTSSYTLKITDSNPVGASKQTALSWANANTGITVNANKTIYAILVDNEGQIGGAATGNVDKIDTQKPVANITNTTTNSITFTGTDTAKTGEKASGVAGYIVQESNVAPSKTDSAWKSYNGASKTVSGLTQGKTYYVFVKDNAGNVSVAASKGTGNVTISKGNITSSVKSWNGKTATVEFKTNTGYYIQTKVGNENWSANPATTGTATANATTGTIVYARLTDSTGQYNNGDVASITPVLTYTIAFNSNGGSGNMGSLTSRAYGKSYTLTANSFSKSGSHFKGWNTKADGTGTTYSNGASVSNLTTTNGATVTLYAMWEQHSYSSSVVTASTCTANGTRKYTCTVCGSNYQETIAALGHTGNEGGKVTQYTSCTNDGYRYKRCTRCHKDYGGTYKYENAWGHTGNEGGTITQSTSCTNDGYRYKRCTRCHKDYGGTYKYENKWGHNSDGIMRANEYYHVHGYCTRCGCEMMTQTEAGKINHNFQYTTQTGPYVGAICWKCNGNQANGFYISQYNCTGCGFKTYQYWCANCWTMFYSYVSSQ